MTTTKTLLLGCGIVGSVLGFVILIGAALLYVNDVGGLSDDQISTLVRKSPPQWVIGIQPNCYTQVSSVAVQRGSPSNGSIPMRVTITGSGRSGFLFANPPVIPLSATFNLAMAKDPYGTWIVKYQDMMLDEGYCKSGGPPAAVATPPIVAVTAHPAPAAVAPPPVDAGVYLVVSRPNCCARGGWQRDLAAALSAHGALGFPGSIVRQKVVRKSDFESRLDDMVIGPMKSPGDMSRLVGSLPVLLKPLAAKTGDDDLTLEGDPTGYFRIGMYSFHVELVVQ